tara:strand:+ start:227 stop:433 length:207 start_codon:yes stop_codon:yes gene_type:complete
MKVIIYIICWNLYVYFSRYIPKKYETYNSIIFWAFLIYAAYWAFFVFPNTQPDPDQVIDGVLEKLLFE